MNNPHEHGAISTFLAVLALAMLMAAGLAIDGGRKVNTLREASNLADNAARAGAQAVDLPTLRATGEIRIDHDAATQRVASYLAPTDAEATITTDTDTVTVTVTIAIEPILLPTGMITVTATETATATTVDP